MKNFYKKAFVLTLLVTTLVPVGFAMAQENTGEYVLLVSDLPGIEETTTLSEYLPAVFNLSIGIAAALAFVMITFGGIMYATTDAISGKETGKKYITDAIWGLLLVIGAYAILWTINPRILEFDLRINRPVQTAGGSAGGTVVGGGAGSGGGVGIDGCPTCTLIPRLSANITATGKEVGPVLVPKLISLDQQLVNAGVGWRITEAHPPSRTHQNECHGQGTCIDANVSSATPANINTFSIAAGRAGLTAVYEVGSEEAKKALVDRGVTVRIDVVPPKNGVPQISAPHFSVYNK